MKNRKVTITAVLFIIACTNYVSVISHGHIRTVEFLSIFVIGALAGVLVTQLFKKLQ